MNSQVPVPHSSASVDIDMPSCIIGTEEDPSAEPGEGLEREGSGSSSSCDMSQMSKEDSVACIKHERQAPDGNDICNSEQKPGRARSRANWTKDEDVVLRAFVAKEGKDRWACAGRVLGKRTGKQCRNRWYNVLDPNLTDSDWTAEEERRLVALHREIGSRWAMLARHLPGRSENAIKNHWHCTARCKDLRNLKKARNGVLRSYIAQLSSDSSAAEASSHRPQPESAAPNPEKIDRRAKEKRKLPVPAAQKAPALDHDDVRIEVKREDAASTDIDEGSPGQRAKLRKRALSHDVSSSARAPIGNKDGHTADVMEASETKPTKEATVAVGAGEGGRPESGFKGMGLLSLPDNGVVGGGWSEPHENHAPSPPPGQQGNSRWLQVFKQSDDVSNPPVRFRCPDTPAESEKVSHSGVGKGRPLRGSRGGGLSWAQAPPNGDGPAENQLSDADVAPPYEVLAEMEPSTEQCFFTATRSKVLPGMGLTSGTVGKDESCGAGIKRKAERCDLEDILRSLGPPQVIESKLEHSGGVAPLSGIGCGGDGLPRTQSGFSGGGVGSAEWWGARNVPPQSGQFRKPCPLEIADNPAALPMQSPHVSTPSLHETFRSSPTSSNLTSGFCPTLSVQTPVTSAPLPGASVVRSLTEPLPLFYPGAEAGSDTNLSLTSLVMDHINGLLDQQAEKLSRVDPSVPESSTIFSGELFEQHSQLRAALEFLTTLTARAKPEDGPGIPRALPAKSAASNHSPTETSREPAPANPFVIGKPTEEQPWALKSSVQEPTAPKFWTAVKDEYGGDVTGGINQDGPLTAGAQQDPPRGFAPTSEWQPFSLQGHVEPEPGATCCPGKAPVDTVFMGPTTPVTSDWDERLNELTWTEGGAFGGFQSGP